MKIQHYCYTRAKFLDYCVFSRPTNLDQFAIKEIKSKALSVTDSIESKLSTPKWILIKTPEYVVWGICCLNRILSEEYNCDYSGTPISGMFAVVISEYENIQLPYDVEYFRRLYELEVSKFWTRKEAHICQVNEFIAGNFNFIRAIQNDNVNIINTDPFKCLSLGTTNKQDIISAALTLDNVSLLIDNDNIQQATNKKGAFMNCLSSAVAPGSYTVKQLCPQCKEYVSAFTSAGICSTCKEKDQARIVSIKKEEEDMDKQMKYELEVAQNKIAELKSEVESNRQRLKKKDRLIKILVTLLVVLLVTLLYSQDSFSLKLFDKKQETQYTPSLDSRNWDNGRTNNDYMHNQGASFEFLESAINVDANAYNKFPIKVQNNVDKYRAESNVDWIKILTSKNGLITIEIAANEQKESRKGEVIVTYGDSDTSSVVITQNGK